MPTPEELLAVERISAEDLASILRANADETVVVDVRDEDYELKGHIVNAEHLPKGNFTEDADVDALIAKFGNKSDVVFHCGRSNTRGPTCALRFMERAEALGAKAHVRVLGGGFAAFAEKFAAYGHLSLSAILTLQFTSNQQPPNFREPSLSSEHSMGKEKNAAKNAKPNADANAPVKATPAKAAGGKTAAVPDATKASASAAAATAATTVTAQMGGKNGKNGTNAKAAATTTAPSDDISSVGKNAKKGANVKASAANDSTATKAQATSTKANKNAKEPTNDKAAANTKAIKNDQGTTNAQTTKNNKAATNAKTPIKNDKAAANTNADTNYKASELSDVTVANVQRARQLRKSDPERYSKFRNFFTATDTEAARQIASQIHVKREQVNKWVRSCVAPKVFTCIEECQESQQDLMALVAVSVALTKYGEQELARRDSLGEMDYLVGSRFGTSGLKSKTLIALQMGEQSTVDVNFVLRLVLGLAPEKRDACQQLRDMLNLGANSRLTLALPSKNSKSSSTPNKTNSKNNDKTNDKTDKAGRDRLLQIAKHAQSDRFQETMQQVGGQQLYDAIRTLVKEADASTWDAAKDKPALQGKNMGTRVENVKNATGAKQKKETQRNKQQPAKKADQQKRHLPVEIEKSWVQVPPPAPVNMKNSTPGKGASAVKDKMAGGVGPAGSVQSRPTAIVNSTSSIDTHATTGGRSIGSRSVAL
ncbi:hypothetical protein BBJ29_005921 [Phytophthora kernoviae]|uniref:Rhodanese domain-containing protein n=1 Tax=Phytophthora kernoviae TaxID=325452 RepID=A0A3F2RH95_9STRA|nr:hypothetical protein BBP00_00007756 [Phytophthora kernoviae]RLN60478.1 hypothetical protein BBJ29_005921 [Phytophthora kernoviae]